MPPPPVAQRSIELLPLMMLSLIVSVAAPAKPSLKMPPPNDSAELPLIVLLISVTVALPEGPVLKKPPPLNIPPPKAPSNPVVDRAELPLIVLLLTVRRAFPPSLALLKMAPPNRAELLLTVQFATVRFAWSL